MLQREKRSVRDKHATAILRIVFSLYVDEGDTDRRMVSETGVASYGAVARAECDGSATKAMATTEDRTPTQRRDSVKS